VENAPWQTTATRVFCEAVAEDTIIVVRKDWCCLCTYHAKWGPARRLKRAGLARILSRLGIAAEERLIVTDRCKGPKDCLVTSEYVQRLLLEQRS